MAIDFSSLDATPAKTGKIDFTALGAIPAVGQDEPIDETTALGAAGRGAASMIPLGTQALAATAGAFQNEPYLQERQEIEKETQADIANHPVARLGGQAAGVVAPALLTGGSSVPESILGAAGQGAAIGAGFGAGNAIDTLASGGSGAKAAGEVALGGGLGAVGGAAGQGLAGLLGEAVPGIESYAAKKAIQGVGMGSEELGNMGQQELADTGRMLMDTGIVKSGKSTQEMFDTAKTMQDQYGDQIGQIGNQAKQLGLSTDTKPLLAALEDKYQAASALQNPDEVRNALFYKKGMADILTMSRQNLPDTLAGVQGAPVPSDITFDQLQRLKKSYGNSAFMNGTVKNPAAADVYSQLSAGQKAIVNSAQDNPNLPDELKTAMAGYSKLYPVVDGLQDVLGKERAGAPTSKGFGMIGRLVGQLPGQDKPVINALTSLGLLGAGHPLWALGAATATLQNPRALSTMAQSAAEAIPGVASALPTAGAQLATGPIHQNLGEIKPINSQGTTSATGSANPTAPTALNIDHPALAQWKPVFQKNAARATNQSEIQKSNAVTDFVLSQRDPAYAAAKQKAADNPVSTESSPNLPNQTQNKATGMADGGVVPPDQIQPKSLLHDNPPPPAPSTPSMNKGGAPFNSALADQLKEYLKNQKEKNNGGS
jgi:hypothetical protein